MGFYNVWFYPPPHRMKSVDVLFSPVALFKLYFTFVFIEITVITLYCTLYNVQCTVITKPASGCSMGGSPGELNEELVTWEERKKGWRMNCDVGEATEGL